MTALLLCPRGSLMTGGAPKWRTIKTVFSLPGSDDLEGGIFQSNWYVWFGHLASGHLLFLKQSMLQFWQALFLSIVNK
jgi:hypothetical protein